jgi:hypothetical protein
LLPEHEAVLPRLLEHKETHELIINRCFNISPGQVHTETVVLGMQAEEVQVGIAGGIGYYFRLFKGSGFSSYNHNPDNEAQG